MKKISYTIRTSLTKEEYTKGIEEKCASSWSFEIYNPLEEKIVEAANKLAFEIGVSVGTANRLVRAGFLTADGIKAAGLEQLLEIEKINVKEVTAAFDKLMQ